jgi:16S rRNA (guanine527-N7)-methyltransferase
MRDQFIKAIISNQQLFGMMLDQLVVAKLADYYELVLEHNPLLHLVGPCSPEEFATRHILESLTMLEFLPANAKFCDVGSGAGLPAIPCLIVRDDLTAILIESKEKKTRFLETVAFELGLKVRTRVVNKQFEESDPNNAEVVTCRALDKFSGKLTRLIKWANPRQMLFFGGPLLGIKMREYGLSITPRLMPLSERRYLFAGKSQN